MRAGGGILAVAGTVDPEALAGVVLDLEIVPHRDQLGIAFPPFAEHALGAVGALHAAADAAPGEADRVDGRAAARSLRSAPAWATVATAAASGPAMRRRCQAPLARSVAPSVPARRWRPERSDRDVSRRRGWRACRSDRRRRPPALPRAARRPVSARAARQASRQAVMISMPKPGSMVSILSQSSRVRRFTSRTGSRGADADRFDPVVDAMQQQIETPRAEAFRSREPRRAARQACRCSGRWSRPRRSARRRRGAPRSDPEGGSGRSARRDARWPGRAGGRAQGRSAARAARAAAPASSRDPLEAEHAKTGRPCRVAGAAPRSAGRATAVALSPGGSTMVGSGNETGEAHAPRPSYRRLRHAPRCRTRQAARPCSSSMAASPPCRCAAPVASMTSPSGGSAATIGA